MIIVFKKHISSEAVSKIGTQLSKHKLRFHIFGKEGLIKVFSSHTPIKFTDSITKNPFVKKVVDSPYMLSSIHVGNKNTSSLSQMLDLKVKGPIFMAGPCSVENKSQIVLSAKLAKLSGSHVLRGGAYKPRTSPYEFQGLGVEGLKLMHLAAKKYSLLSISEVLDPRDIEVVNEYIDILQVGTRNMYNYALLKELGKIDKPVLLKRSMNATYKEFLLAAEYILSGGNKKVILCERGIRTFISETRFTLDINAVLFLKKETHLPVVVDPSHATGLASLVRGAAFASISAGADGLLIEMHPKPELSIRDKSQTINSKELI
ncbi:MAG: 3-deoxy-7-phosphoheptulonate synthase [Candidatus Roizmanbacteria bacterium]|nr:3-deoxy-7-phosphoheptulonate synthase [Candidatus Roizmanbacteria bacterium]